MFWPIIARAVPVLGICGGYQMLGRTIADPDGVEGEPGESTGLGLLDVDTVLGGDKRLVETRGRERQSGESVRGYEMHVGRTSGPDTARALLELDAGPDGAVSADGRVMGCYLHGLFAADGFRHVFLSRLRARNDSGVAFDADVEDVLDRLAAHLETHLDGDRLLELT